MPPCRIKTSTNYPTNSQHISCFFLYKIISHVSACSSTPVKKRGQIRRDKKLSNVYINLLRCLSINLASETHKSKPICVLLFPFPFPIPIPISISNHTSNFEFYFLLTLEVLFLSFSLALNMQRLPQYEFGCLNELRSPKGKKKQLMRRRESGLGIV